MEYIFSGILGDADLFIPLISEVEDVNIGRYLDIDNMGMNTSRGSNKNLVHNLVQYHGVVLETIFSHILFRSINNPDMVPCLIEDLRIRYLDVISRTFTTV